MDTEAGKIVEVKGDKVVVQMEPGEQCHHCGARFACTAMGENVRQITADNRLQAKIGDRVRISYRPQMRVFSGLVLFIFPILLGIVGYFVGYSLFGTEGSGILGTFAGFIVAFFIVWLINRIYEKREHLPTVLRIEVQ